jgi:hypothetical protein
LYLQPYRPTVTAICEDIRVKELALSLSEPENTSISVPTYHQVYGFVKSIEEELPVQQARSGLSHAPRARMSPQSFVLSIPYPAHICQVDEHTMDLLVVASDGTVLTRRVHAAVLICVKTAAILGAVLALDALREEDYLRLVKMAVEPKDRITALYDCQNAWPCSGFSHCAIR